jgi:hypothetical protein
MLNTKTSVGQGLDQAGERSETGSFFVSNKISVNVNGEGHSYDYGTAWSWSEASLACNL